MTFRMLFFCLAAAPLASAGFEKIALVDGFDYAPLVDTETSGGVSKILERVV